VCEIWSPQSHRWECTQSHNMWRQHTESTSEDSTQSTHKDVIQNCHTNPHSQLQHYYHESWVFLYNPDTKHQRMEWKQIMTEAQKLLLARVKGKHNVDHFLINRVQATEHLCLKCKQWTVNSTHRYSKGYWSWFQEWHHNFQRKAVDSVCTIPLLTLPWQRSASWWFTPTPLLQGPSQMSTRMFPRFDTSHILHHFRWSQQKHKIWVLWYSKTCLRHPRLRCFPA
jgi:hypothetical protein